MALSGQAMPDHSTIADFISRSPEAIKTVFQEVLLTCDAAGLIGRELFAIDGVKLPSNASKEWSGRHEELKAKADKLERAVERMLEVHKDEDTKDSAPDLQAHAERQRKKLERHSEKIRAFLAQSRPKIGHTGKERKSNVTDNDSAKLTTGKGVIQGYVGVAVTDAEHQIIVEAQAHGAPQEQELLQPVLEGTQEHFQDLGLSPNILSEVPLTADSGFHSEANLQWLSAQDSDAYVADHGFRKRDPRFAEADKYKPPKPQPKKYRPADFEYDPIRLTCRCPAGKALYRNGVNVNVGGRHGIKFTAPKTACRDCNLRVRCLRNENQKSPRQVVFFDDTRLDKEPTHSAKMKAKIDSPRGRMIYSRRLGTVEPPFGNIRSTKGMNRFTLRGREKVDGQWKLYAMVHNIEKLAHYGGERW